MKVRGRVSVRVIARVYRVGVFGEGGLENVGSIWFIINMEFERVDYKVYNIRIVGIRFIGCCLVRVFFWGVMREFILFLKICVFLELLILSLGNYVNF